MRLGTRSVLVLGAGGVTGHHLLRLLAEDPAIARVIATAPEPIPGLPSKAKYQSIDLMTDDSIILMAELIDSADIDTLVYMGYLSDRRETQEAQAAETRRVIDALERRPVPQVVFASTVAVYGAVPGDPTHLSENTLFVSEPHSAWVKDKVASERLVHDFVLDSDSVITILRFAIPLGPTVRNFMTDYLCRKAVPVVADIDPNVQFIHEEDIGAALRHAILHEHDGPFNMVGFGALPLSVALRIGRRRSAPVPELGSYPLHHALWEPDIIEAPAVLQDLFEYIWVADGTRAGQVMKFSPRFSTKETVEDFYKPKNRKK